MSKRIHVKQLVCSAACIALAFVLSFVKVFQLPYSGSVTLCSMFFICYAGYCFGPVDGLICGVIYSILQYMQGAYIISPLQLCCDYFLAFAALGISGFFHRKGYKGLLAGYVLACLLRGGFHTLGGFLFYMDYVPESFRAHSITYLYPIVYNYSYILAEMAITIVIILIPSVRKTLERLKHTALED